MKLISKEKILGASVELYKTGNLIKGRYYCEFKIGALVFRGEGFTKKSARERAEGKFLDALWQKTWVSLKSD